MKHYRNFSLKLLRIALLVLIYGLLQACSSVAVQNAPEQNQLNTVNDKAVFTLESLGVPPDAVFAQDIYDPWEGMNRRIYNFNAKLDEHIMLPVIYAYRGYIPRFARQGINNFFSNLTSINHTMNSALQLKGKSTFNNGMRFISNSTIGILGLFDVATGMGFPQITEDFGQVLGYWGVKEGPYLVLPFFGPSNLRDTAGLGMDFIVADLYLNEFGMNEGAIEWTLLYYALLGIDARDNIEFRYYDSLTPFEYDFIRMMYTKQRRIQIGE
jgi:phospholipid-binding lipoprotein MlaA